MRSPAGLALLALLAACQGGSGTPAGPVAGPSAVAQSGVAASNEVAAPAPVLELTGTAAFATSGTGTTSLQAGSETGVDPRSSFRVELAAAFPDARLSLLDAGDAMVPASGTREVGQATLLTLAPTAALPAGARLRLRVDGAATRELHGADGRRFAPVEWPVLVAGEPPDRKPPGRKGKRR